MKATFEQFAELWQELGCMGEPADVFRVLERQYSEPPRAYHTLEHVGWGLKRIDELRAALSLGITVHRKVKWAMWFHDARMSFDPERGRGDELASAALAEGTAIAAGLGNGWARDVHALVMATAHTGLNQGTPGADVLVDADLAILAADEQAFDEYEWRVRLEWGHVSDTDFRIGRLAVLQRFNAMKSIYSTTYAREKWEPKARFNLLRSMCRLVSVGNPRVVMRADGAR